MYLIDYFVHLLQDHHITYADTLNESHDNLKRLLQLIDYTNIAAFLSIRPELETTITSAALHIGATVLSNSSTFLYYLPKERALEFDDT